jgi:predicted metalloprotease
MGRNTKALQLLAQPLRVALVAQGCATSSRLRRRSVLLAVLIALIAGCGGDDGGGNSDADGTTEPDHYAEIVELAKADIDEFWSGELGAQYQSPTAFHPYDPARPPEIACDPSNWEGNAFYCPPDSTISWDETWLRDGVVTFSEIQDMVPLTILAHEWGHHIQNLVGSGALDVQQELQADCYAGLYVDYADSRSTRITLEPGDVSEAMAALFTIADDEFHQGNWYAEGAHGDGPARRLAYARGWITADRSFCTDYDNYELREPATVGTFTLSLPPNSTVETSDRGIVSIESHDLTLQVQGRELTGMAAEAMPTYAREWFGEDAQWETIGAAEDFGAVPAGMTAATQRYQQLFTDEEGVEQTVHGALFLLVDGSGNAVGFDVWRGGPAPADNAEWEELGDFLYSSVFGLSAFDDFQSAE